MVWMVVFHPDFDVEFMALPRDVQTMLAARARLIEEFGPGLGQPHTDTLEGSRHANMKELRFSEPTTACGGSPSPSIRRGRLWSWSAATSRAAASVGSIGG